MPQPWEMDQIVEPATTQNPWEVDPTVDEEGRVMFPSTATGMGTVTVTKDPGYLKRTLSALSQGLISIPEFLSSVAEKAPMGVEEMQVRDPFEFKYPTAQEGMPSWQLEQLRDSIDIPAENDFQRYYKTGLQGVGGSIGPGGPVKNAIAGAVGSLGGEVAADVGGEGAATRVGGSLGAQALLATALSKGRAKVNPNADAILKEGLENVSAEDLELAKLSMEEAARRGINLDVTQALKGDSNLTVVRDVLANSKYGDRISKMLRDQPEEVQRAVEAEFRKLGGKVLNSPQAAANVIQEVSTKYFKRISQKASDAYRSALKGASDEVSPAKVAELDKALVRLKGRYNTKDVGDYIEALRARLKDPAKVPAKGDPTLVNAGGRPLRGGEGDTSTYRTSGENIYKNLQEEMGGYKSPTLNDDAAKKLTRRINKDVEELLDATILPAGAANREARNAYRSVMELQYNPAKKGPLGRVAGKGAALDKESPLAALEGILRKGSDPRAAGVSEIKRTIRTLGAVSKEETVDAVTTIHSKMLNEALSLKEGSVDETTAKRLYETFYANPAKRKGMREVIGEIATLQGKNREQLVSSYDNLMHMVEKAGKRPQTTKGLTAEQVADMAKFTKMASALRLSGLFANVHTAVQLEKRMLGKTLQHIDRILATPEGVDYLVKLTRDRDNPKKMYENALLLGKLVVREEQNVERAEDNAN